jgi:hypothetical protein
LGSRASQADDTIAFGIANRHQGRKNLSGWCIRALKLHELTYRLHPAMALEEM